MATLGMAGFATKDAFTQHGGLVRVKSALMQAQQNIAFEQVALQHMCLCDRCMSEHCQRGVHHLY